MAELRGGRDEPDGSDLPARRYPADADDGAGETRPRAEPGPRAEYAVTIKQIVDQERTGEGQAAQAESSHAEAVQANANHAEAGAADDVQESSEQGDPDQVEGDSLDAGQAHEDLGSADKTEPGQADAIPEGADPGDAGQDDADPADADPATEPLDGGALKRCESSRAGLPEVSHDDAAAYIEEHQADRPWLAAVRECSPDTQRIFVALDQGHGHAHIRHDGWAPKR